MADGDEVLAGRSHATRVIDLEGATVCPGFYDSHAHMDREGLKARGGFSLAGRHSGKDIVEGARLGVEKTPPGEWAVFMPLGTQKLNYISRPDQLAEGRFPTRHDLDAAAVAVVTLDVEAPVGAEPFVEPRHQILDRRRAGGRCGRKR